MRAVVASLADAMRQSYGSAPEATSASLPDVDPADLRAHKLTAPYVWLRSLGGDVTGTPWATESRRQRRRAAVLADELGLVAGRLHADNVPFAVLRGPALGSCYPPGWPREANDIDLLVPTVRHVAPALAALRGMGYVVGRPMVCRRDLAAGGAWVGLALRRARPDLEHPMYLDLVAGGPAVGRVSCVPIGDDAWDGRSTVRVHDADVPVFSPTTLLLILAVELMERATPIGRDVLDFLAVGSREPDWARVRAQVRRHGVGAGLARLARYADQVAVPAAERMRWLSEGRGRPPGSARRACLAVTDTLYRRTVHVAPNLALSAVERAPTRLWYRLGLPVYAYPPGAARGPLLGVGGHLVASLPGFRARVRPVARSEEVRDVFADSESMVGHDVVAGGRLTGPELSRWQESLADQLLSAASDGTADKAHVVDYVGRNIVDRGADGTVGVRRGGGLVAAGRLVDCMHPLTKQRDRRLDGMWAHADAVGLLLQELPGDQPLRTTVPVHGTAAGLTPTLKAAGFRPEVVTVRKSVEPTSGTAATAQLRAARDADLPFVQDCVAAAVRRGLFGRTAQGDVDDWVRKHYTDITSDDVVCLVAEDGGELAGHALATFREDRYGPAPCAFIVDVFVVPQRHGQGHARALTGAIGDAIAERGVAVLESEVAIDDGAPALRANLAAGGWTEDRIVWVKEPG